MSIISGGNKDEIISLLKKNKCVDIFDGLILGNPLPKHENFKLFCAQFDPKSCVYIGDSILDYELANEYKMEFRFVYDWSEVEGHENHPALQNAILYPSISDIIKEFEGLTFN